MKQFLKIFVTLGLIGLAAFSLAQLTLAGTRISNTATATFTDSNNVSRTATSNTVETIVQTVYSFNIEPDDSFTPSASTDFSLYPPTTEDGLNTVTNATSTTNTTFATGVVADVAFSYTVTNNTNNDDTDTDQEITIELEVVQGSADDFDLTNIRVYTFTDSTTGPNANGRYDIGETLSSSPIFTTGTGTLTFPGQSDFYNVVVFADIPTGTDGNENALLDLVGTNLGNTLAGAPTAGANTSYESNNIAYTEVAEVPLIGAAKDLGTVTNNGDGTYNVEYTITLENLGNVPLSYIQVSEDLSAVFGTLDNSGALDANSYRLASGSPSSTDFTVNSSFNGDTDTNLLTTAAANDLALNTTGTISLEIIVNPGSNLGPYNNSVTAYGFSPDDAANPSVDKNDPVNDASTQDTSADGANPDPNNDGDPSDDPEDSAVTPLTFTQNPVIGAAKEAGTVLDNGDGTFTVPFTVTLENLGDMNLHDVQITEDLSDFGSYVATVGDVDAAGEYAIDNLTVNDSTTAPALDTSSTFNGDSDTALLDLTTNAVLERTQTVTITFDVVFYPDFANSPFENQVTATGDLPRNADGAVDNDTQDLSDNGTDPDPSDGAGGAPNGDPTDTGEDDPTPVTVPSNAEIGAAKQAGTITDNGDGTFTVPFTVTIENLGNVDLYDVQVTDELTTEFGTFVTAVGDVDASGEYTVSDPVVTDGTTTPALATNTAFNGDTNQNLLTLSSTAALEVGETVTITFNLTFYPDFANAPFTNQAVASGDAPDAQGEGDGDSDNDTQDTSTNGTDPDGTDNDNNPDENDPTPISPTLTSRLGVAKQAGTPTSNGDGTFDVDFTFTVENFGNVDLYDVQVTDSLTAEFGTYEAAAGDVDTAGEYTVSAVTVTDGTPGAAITENTGFTGSGTDTSLLSLTDNDAGLEVDETITVVFTLTFYPDPSAATVAGNNLTFNNQANATGDRPDANNNGDGTTNNNSSSSDTSTNGTDPDDDNDGTVEASDTDNNPSESVSTPITITMAPVIGVAKQAGSVTDNNDGTFTVTYTINVENMGNVDAHDVQVTEDLAAEFGTYAATADSAGEFTVSAVSLTTNAANALTENSAFDGDADTGLLDVAAGGHIRPGETVTLEFDLTFYPDFTTASITGTSAIFTNQVTATADNPVNDDAGADNDPSDTSDTSDDGTDPRGTGGDGDAVPNETNENDATEITITAEPVIGVSKDADVTDFDLDSDDATVGPFEITFDFYLENMGNVDLTNISLTDNLSAQFGTLNVSPSPLAAGEYEIVSITRVSGPTTVTANTGFNGDTDEDVISTTSSLLVDETAQIQLVINVFSPGAYTNQATATADGPGTTTTTDDSTDGTDPDGPTNNDDPTDSDDPTPISLDAVNVSKDAQICDDAACGTVLTAWTQNTTNVNPTEFIAYRITAENQGGGDVEAVIVTDPVPAPTRFVSVGAVTGPAGTIVECSTDNGTSWGTCPTTTSPYNTAPLVTHLRMMVAGGGTGDLLPANGDASFIFTVYVP